MRSLGIRAIVVLIILAVAVRFSTRSRWLPISGDVRLPGIFSDGMVLQEHQPVPIWGWANPGETVTVSLGKSVAHAKAGSQGNWRVTLPPQSSGLDLTLTVTGKDVVSIRNVAIGEVWVCSGQSNMAFKMETALGAENETADANYANLRFYDPWNDPSATPLQDFKKGNWVSCTPVTARKFSAIGYLFGREIHKKLKVPVGIIVCTRGGSTVEAWTSRPALEQDPTAKNYLATWDRLVLDYPVALTQYRDKAIPDWQQQVRSARDFGLPAPRKPDGPPAPDSTVRPANLFNSLLHPAIPYAIKGVLWYQGESNVDRPSNYASSLPTLIRDWRKQWGQGNFPFYYVQLANIMGPQKLPVESGSWPLLREAQQKALTLPNTGMVTAVDAADEVLPGMHPRNKKPIASRLAQLALAQTYGQNLPFSGPILRSVLIRNHKIKIAFDFAEGLRFRDHISKGFAIAGDGGAWKWADAAINGNTVTLSNRSIQSPTKVRYDWAPNPVGNLYNGAGLPALPFRTDTDTTQ